MSALCCSSSRFFNKNPQEEVVFREPDVTNSGMELGDKSRRFVRSPTSAFASIREVIQELSDTCADEDLQNSWDNSASNPKNLIATFDLGPAPSWTVEGISNNGTRFHVTPNFLRPDVPPYRIDIFVEGSENWSTNFRRLINFASLTHIADSRAADHGLSRIVVIILERWKKRLENSVPDVKTFFANLDFGSSIHIDNITEVLSTARVFIRTPPAQWRSTLMTAAELQHLWDLPDSAFPPSLPFTGLLLLSSTSETICRVNIPRRSQDEVYIFKSCIEPGLVKSMYHELKLLLTMPKHANIIERPFYLVTLQHQPIVIGFILPFHPNGTLHNVLPLWAANSLLSPWRQLRWARQICSALQHIRFQCKRYYSDLKLDNIILSQSDEVVLLDFEQNGNWRAWAAPEIYYYEYLQKLLTSSKTPAVAKSRYQILWHALFQRPLPTNSEQVLRYDNPDQGYFEPWISMTAAEQEAAEVFSFGKVLWCIFEGVPAPGNTLSRSSRYESWKEFPGFWNTPVALRKLILACTTGARERDRHNQEWIVRRDSVFLPKGASGFNGERTATLEETADACIKMWKREVEKMEAFWSAKLRLICDQASEEDLQILHYLRRPRLADVESDLAQYASAYGLE